MFTPGPALVRKIISLAGASCVALAAAACGGGTSGHVAPAVPGHEAQAQRLVPAAIDRPIPPPPPSMAVPPLPSSVGRRVRDVTPHPAFFRDEAFISNGVYYLNMPNGAPFGYYSYLSDPRYIYHFEMGYEYVVDANDSNGGLYLFDFASNHWWYTSRTYAFPYLYDFTLAAVLYYYPDANGAGHYTTNPRWFHNFGTGQDLQLPDPTRLAGTAQNVYLHQFDPNTNGSTGTIFAFPGSANGTASPTRQIGSANYSSVLVVPSGEFFGCGRLHPANSTTGVTTCGPVARDKKNGHLYEGLTEYAADGSTVVRTMIVPSGAFGRTQSTAVDSAGNFYYGDSGHHVIYVFPPGATTPSRYLGGVPNSPIYDPYALAFDSHDVLYDLDDGALYRFDPSSNGATPMWKGGTISASGRPPVGLPISLAIDEQDDVYLGHLPSSGYGPVIDILPPASATNVRGTYLDLTGITGPGDIIDAIAIGP